jgi:hypothetical protein
MFDLEEALNALPLQPSERYLAEVVRRKKPRGPYLALVRPYHGRPPVAWSANLLKAARKAMAMAYWEAQKLPGYGIVKRPANPRQLAANVLTAFMTLKVTELAPGITTTVPGRFAYQTHAEYAAAISFYVFNLKPRLLLQKPMPGVPGQQSQP